MYDGGSDTDNSKYGKHTLGMVSSQEQSAHLECRLYRRGNHCCHVLCGDWEYTVIYGVMMLLAIYGTKEFIQKYKQYEEVQ